MYKEGDKFTFLGNSNQRYLAYVLGVVHDCTWVKVSKLKMVYEVFPNQVIEVDCEKLIISYDKRRSFQQIVDPTFLETDNFMLEADTAKRERMQKLIKAELLICPH